MESNRRPGKGAPRKKSSPDSPKPSVRLKKTVKERSNFRSVKPDEESPRTKPSRNSEDRPFRRTTGKPLSEDHPYRSSSVDRPTRPATGKPGNEDRPRHKSDSDRPFRSGESDRPARRSSDKPAYEERPRRSGTSDRPTRPSAGRPGNGVRSSRDGAFDPPSRRPSDKPGKEKRPYRDDSTDKPPRRTYEKTGNEDRPRQSNTTRSPGSSSGQGLIRLNKYIANSGICSRREADELILAGTVVVNGKIVTELGTKVSPSDKVQYDDRVIRNERHVYVLLNKPKGYITTTDDPFDRKTVMTLVADACKERIYPVGRLDRNTTGLLLLTNDGDMAKKLTHPRHKVKKVYQVELDKALAKNDMMLIAGGIELDDGMAQIDEIAYTSENSKKEVGIELHSGKNRIVRRIFESIGYEVVKLDRVVFAGLTKKDLPRGHWRILSEQEVNYLKMLK
jgi:23S rRNA pseudouridine2605 synthase